MTVEYFSVIGRNPPFLIKIVEQNTPNPQEVPNYMELFSDKIDYMITHNQRDKIQQPKRFVIFWIFESSF